MWSKESPGAARNVEEDVSKWSKIVKASGAKRE
jgi:hypothetical protein